MVPATRRTQQLLWWSAAATTDVSIVFLMSSTINCSISADRCPRVAACSGECRAVSVSAVLQYVHATPGTAARCCEMPLVMFCWYSGRSILLLVSNMRRRQPAGYGFRCAAAKVPK